MVCTCSLEDYAFMFLVTLIAIILFAMLVYAIIRLVSIEMRIPIAIDFEVTAPPLQNISETQSTESMK